QLRLSVQIQPEIQRDLIVAAAGGMKFPTHRADPADQLPLNGVMNILFGRQSFTTLDIPGDGFKSANNTLRVFRRNNPAFRKHSGMRDTPRDVVGGQSDIER